MENKSEFWWEFSRTSEFWRDFFVRLISFLPFLTVIVVTIVGTEQFDKTFLICLAVVFGVVFIAITDTLSSICCLHKELETLKEEIKELKNGNNEHNIY